METKVACKRIERLRWRLKLPNFLGVDSNGRSGGMALFWSKEVSVSLKTMCNSFFDLMVKEGNSEWRLTCVYGEPRAENRHHTWARLRALQAQDTQVPWAIMGDFNEVLWQTEHQSATPRSESMMEAFRNCLTECEVADLGFSGYPFTWNNKRGGDENVQCRLDRVVVNDGWRDLFPQAEVCHVEDPKSDHLPLLLRLQPATRATHQRGPNLRYEIMWQQHPNFKKEVQKIWAETEGGSAQLVEKMKEVLTGLKGWERAQFGSVRRRLRALETRLARLRRRQPNLIANQAAMREVEAEMVELFRCEEIMWKQRARLTWLKEGDRNTKFFHRRASERKRKNTIKELQDENGMVFSEQVDLLILAKDFFSKLFTSEGTSNQAAVLNPIPALIDKKVNESLMAEFTREEVRRAVFQMGPWKAPGPDGLPAAFYQTHWETVQQEVVDETLRILNGGHMPEGFNDTLLVLIPKVQDPHNFSQFRPISLCNVAYKIISKVLANRLKPLLPSIISQEQSAFVEGRLITNNILTAYECLHTVKNRTQGNRALCAVKLDMSKAYNRIEWEYLRNVMLKFGFQTQWVELIMKCVTSPTFSVIVNGERTEKFSPSRGLRQGDPISPYLFLLCAEGLSHLMHKEVARGGLDGVKVCRSAPVISHLLFADDSAMFMEANRHNALKLKKILQDYCRASGQRVNEDKSSVFFSPNTPNRMRNQIKRVLRIQKEALTEKYLGLPTAVGARKNEAFRHITERVHKKLMGWKEKFLSQGGKEVLIKSVIQAIPSYSMQCFRLPKKICAQLARCCNNFWWGSTDEKKKIHWRSWRKMAKPKLMGGLGFRDFELFNQALLAKQGWRMLQNPSSLCARILKAKYYHNSNFLEAKVGAAPSATWSVILHGREALKKSLVWRIGNGESVRIWQDGWLPNNPEMRVSTEFREQQVRLVSHLIEPQSRQWRRQLVEETFNQADAQQICKIPLTTKAKPDLLAWQFETTGLFSVKSLYRCLIDSIPPDDDDTAQTGQALQESEMHSLRKAIWKVHVPSKVHVFLWRLNNKLLPVRVQLIERRMEVQRECLRCNGGAETCIHALWECPSVKPVWEGICHDFNALFRPAANEEDVSAWLHENLVGKTDMQKVLFATTAWQLWHERNSVRVGQQPREPKALIGCISKLVEEYAHTFQLRREPAASTHQPSRAEWQKPAQNWVKLNTDVSIDKHGDKTGLGIVIRDSDGRCMGGRARMLRGMEDPLTGEALALKEGLGFALEKGHTKIVAETDSLQLWHLLNSHLSDYSVCGAIIRDIKDLAVLFSDFTTSHVKREANFLAHNCAQFATSCNSVLDWDVNFPFLDCSVSILHDHRRDE